MREMTPSLKALADSPARVNRDMARQLAIPLGLSKEVEDLCQNHECYLCNNDFEWHCERCERPICSECDGSGIFSQYKVIDYNCCTKCANSDYGRDEDM